MYDIRDDAAADRLRRERAAWRDRADVVTIDADHRVLVVRPGLAGKDA